MRAIVVLASVGTVAVALFATGRAAPTKIPRAPAQKFGVHLKDHTWAHPPSLSRDERRSLLRRIARHDKWVIATARLHHPATVERHRRELRNARAKLRQLGAAVVPLSGWHTSLMTSYSWAEGGSHTTACGDYLTNDDLSFASYLVPCGARVEFCSASRCAVGRRTDSGPNPMGVNGWWFDLNYALAIAAGHPEPVCSDGSCSGGVGSLRWRLVR